jgi:hypothetical protein
MNRIFVPPFFSWADADCSTVSTRAIYLTNERSPNGHSQGRRDHVFQFGESGRELLAYGVGHDQYARIICRPSIEAYPVLKTAHDLPNKI